MSEPFRIGNWFLDEKSICNAYGLKLDVNKLAAGASGRAAVSPSPHREREKVKARLIGDLNPGHGELPPKPKWIRWPKAPSIASIRAKSMGSSPTM